MLIWVLSLLCIDGLFVLCFYFIRNSEDSFFSSSVLVLILGPKKKKKKKANPKNYSMATEQFRKQTAITKKAAKRHVYMETLIIFCYLELLRLYSPKYRIFITYNGFLLLLQSCLSLMHSLDWDLQP